MTAVGQGLVVVSAARRPIRVLLLLASCATLVLLGTGCSSSVPMGRMVPTTLDDCGAAAHPGNPDGGMVGGLDWPSGSWALRTPAQAYVCLGQFPGGYVTLTSSGGSLTVQPARFAVPDGGGVVPVSITVTASGNSTLLLRLFDRKGNEDMNRAVAMVVADDRRWHFQRAG
jgi:hypothetical protein